MDNLQLPRSFDLQDATVGILPEAFDRETIQALADEGQSIRVTFFAGFSSGDEPAREYGWRGYDDSHIVLRRKVPGVGRWIIRTLGDIQLEESTEDGGWSFRGVHKDAWVDDHEDCLRVLSRVFNRTIEYSIHVPKEGPASFQVVSKKTTCVAV